MTSQRPCGGVVLIPSILLVAVCLTPSSHALMVSEIMYNPLDASLEYIELYNERAVFEDISGYAFTNGIHYEFPAGVIMGAKAYLVVALDPNALDAAYGRADSYGPYVGRLNNTGERIELSNESGGIILSFRYNDAHPWPVSPDGTGHSLVLPSPARDPEEGASWMASSVIGGSPGGPDMTTAGPEDSSLVTLIEVGHAGRYFKGFREPSPGGNRLPTTAWTEINFNDSPDRSDWLEGPSGYGYSSDTQELQVVRTQLPDMRGGYMSVYMRLRFDLTSEQIASFSQLQAEVHYDDDYVLYLNGTRVADSGVLPGNPPAFSQGRGGGTDPEPDSVDLSSHLGLLVAGTNVLAMQVHNASLSGSSDCLGSPVLRAVIEPAGEGADPRARLVINELLSHSDAAAATDWLELYNPGPLPVDLTHVYLSDDPADLLKFRIPDAIALEPGEFWAVRQGPGPGDLPFGLNASGETVFVTAANADLVALRVLDALRYGNTPPDRTVGRFPDGSDYIRLLEEASMGAANARPVIHDIVINEIMYHHGLRDERYEFVELYNRGAEVVSLAGWAFTDGISFTFEEGTDIAPDDYLVVAKDPNLLQSLYDLDPGMTFIGPYSGRLNDHSERIRLSYPLAELDPNGLARVRMITADEVTYYDGGEWPIWADGRGTSLELRDPHSDNDTPGAWAASDESGKSSWAPFSFTIQGSDGRYTHDSVSVFDVLLLHQGEVLLDDLRLTINGSNRLTNPGFESGTSSWRTLGNHVQSFATRADSHAGQRSLHLIATGHGDPGANRINQSISSVSGGTVTFQGWAKWLRGSRYLLLRASRSQAPVQPPRPAHAFELAMPLNQGTPGEINTAFVINRGPDILDVQHMPVVPRAGDAIAVSARVVDNDGVALVSLDYRSEGQNQFTSVPMLDNGSGFDEVAGDGLYTAAIPPAGSGTMRAFAIRATDGEASTRFPTLLAPSADVPERTCQVRVGDTLVNSAFARYRIWLSNDVINTFQSRPNLSNELMDCTFVYNESEVFYNARIRFRGSPFLRNGAGRNPRGRYGYRIEFNPHRRFGAREEINLDNTEGGNRGPLQERASYWFYRKMGLQYSRQQFVRPVINGTNHGNYEDVQKIDGDYVSAWFPQDANGYLHKVDDYFEYGSGGTGHRNLDEGLKFDSRHPLIPETYRWGFEKRSHRDDDNWQHIFDFAVAMNTPANSPNYQQAVESVVHPEHFARVLALRHAVGDWDSYGYNRGKNNYFYYAAQEDKWYLLPWDIDFTLGSGNGSNTNLFTVNGGQFPEVQRFLNHPPFRELYLQAFSELVSDAWRTSFGTGEPPTEFDRFLDDSANALIADGMGSGRRDGIKQFVRGRRNFILTQVPSLEFRITTNNGETILTSSDSLTIEGIAPLSVTGISVNGEVVPVTFPAKFSFRVEVPLAEGVNFLALQGLDDAGRPISDAQDSLVVVRQKTCTITSVTPNPVANTGPTRLTIRGDDFTPASPTTVRLARNSDEIGFDALYVRSRAAFDRIDEATLLLDDPGRGAPVQTVHSRINFANPSGQGEFPDDELSFLPPYHVNNDNYAIRFSGVIVAPSAGTRYFGINSDDGFSLKIDGRLVGEFADPRAPATTDVTQNRTAGAMSFPFPAAGRYPVVIDFFENGGGEEIEFFQTNANGGDRRLINVDSELMVFRDNATLIEATQIDVVDDQTITCRVDLTGAVPGPWNLVVTPPSGLIAECTLENALEIVQP